MLRSIAEGDPQKASKLDVRMAQKVPFTWRIPWSGIWPSSSQDSRPGLLQADQIHILEAGMEDSD